MQRDEKVDDPYLGCAAPIVGAIAGDWAGTPGWVPEIPAQQMCAEMVAEDLKAAKPLKLLKAHGLDVTNASTCQDVRAGRAFFDDTPPGRVMQGAAPNLRDLFLDRKVVRS